MWITESLGGMGEDSRTLVTKTPTGCSTPYTTFGSAPRTQLDHFVGARPCPNPLERYCAKVSW